MKLSLIEYGSGVEVTEDIYPLIYRANRIVQRALRLKRNALIISDGKLRALGIAGVMRLSKNIELEIIPKMLDEQEESSWKESLFLLAALSKYGNIVTAEHIHSSAAYKDSLYDIAARILAREYSSHHRKLIRQYHRERFYEYAIDGEIDFDLVYEKNPDGIPQQKVSFDKINSYNATVQAAMKIVLPFVKEASVRQVLSRAIQEFGHQGDVDKHRLKVPARNKEWSEVYNLSYDIISGMGSSLEEGVIMSPSFIVDTWRIWEWLITIAFRIGLNTNFQIVSQATIPWGTKKVGDKGSKVNVYPDIAIYNRGETTIPAFLIDAKYKIISDQEADVDREDLYEAFVYCNATGAKKLFLAYPMTISSNAVPGSIVKLSKYEIADISIYAIKVAFGSVAKQGDITRFCRKLSTEVMTTLW